MSRNAGYTSLIVKLFALPFLAVGLGLIGYVGLKQAEAWRIGRHWTPRPAVVVQRELMKFPHGSRFRFRWTARYAYEVDGRRYESERVDILHRSALIPSTADWALVAPYPPGTAVTAYVDPADPGSAMLSTRVPYLLFFTVVGAIFIAVASLFLLPQRLRPAAALIALDLLTLMLWVYPRSGTLSTKIVIGLLSLPALYFSSRALAGRLRRSYHAF